jgi:hypothetical protein
MIRRFPLGLRSLVHAGEWAAIFVAMGTLMACSSSKGPAHASPAPSRTAVDPRLRDRLRAHVRVLAGDIGPRRPGAGDALERAARYVEATWRSSGFEVVSQHYRANGRPVRNLEVVLPGSDPQAAAIVVGAHYDSAPADGPGGPPPGADDNASGVALLLELGRALPASSLPRPVRLVAFTCEEPPYFQTEDMGSLHYARRLAASGVRVQGMIALESLGYFSDQPGSQQYPAGLSLVYPDRGNFVAVVGNRDSAALVKDVATLLVERSPLPIETGSLPAFLPGVGWSDHWAFWEIGVPAVMLTDTAPFRNPNYHRHSDRVETLDYDSLAALGAALPGVVTKLASR